MIFINNFQKHPDDELDASKIKQIEFRCYACPEGFKDYGSLENHFIQKHPEENLDPKKVYLGNTRVTAAKFKLRKNGRSQNIHEQTNSKNSTPKRTKVSVDVEMKDEVCFVCHETIDENLEFHIVREHFKDRIFEEYPPKHYKCYFANCPHMSIPGMYVNHE